MKPHFNVLFVCCLFGVPSLAYPDEFKPGKAFPTNRNSKPDLTLSSFINQRGPTTDWSLIVLLRDETHYILSGKVNRNILSDPAAKGDVQQILSEPPAQDDMVLLDEAASSFLTWRRLNPATELSVFWKANPQLREQTIRYSSSATGGTSSTSSNAVSDPPESQSPRSSMNPPPSVQPPAPKKAPDAKPSPTTPSEEPTSSTPWSIIVALIVAAIGLLWLLLKRRS